jgi:hypothetical protein
VTYPDGPTALTFATRVVRSFVANASATELHLAVLLGHANEMDEPRLRQRRDEPNADVF